MGNSTSPCRTCKVCGGSLPKRARKYCKPCGVAVKQASTDAASLRLKAAKRAAFVAAGLRSDGVPRAPKKPKQTKAERAACMKAYRSKQRQENVSRGLTTDGKIRKRKFRTREERIASGDPRMPEVRESIEARKRIRLLEQSHPVVIALKAKRKAEYRKNFARTYAKKRRSEDVVFKVKGNLRTLLYIAFSKRAYTGSRRPGRLTMALGCTVERAMQMLEQSFVGGMNWGNYGSKWHIDHIIPVALATSVEQVLLLFHYKNLRPAWGPDNLSKGDKIVVNEILPVVAELSAEFGKKAVLEILSNARLEKIAA